MLWTIFFLFILIVAFTLGFLGLGFGPIEPFKLVFYIAIPFFVITLFMDRRKKRKKYYE